MFADNELMQNEDKEKQQSLQEHAVENFSQHKTKKIRVLPILTKIKTKILTLLLDPQEIMKKKSQFLHELKQITESE